jgi:hypothetical protein
MLLSTYAFSAKDKYLFFQDAPHGSLTKLHNNNFLLALDTSSERVRFFSEHGKKRTSGFMPLSNFISLWNKNSHFREAPPNAVISMVTENGKKQQVIIAVISNPGFDKGKITYQISVLYNDVIQLGEFNYVGLFFDDVPL